MAAERVIFHCDMNNYFASVEELHDPSLRNVPMAICGDPGSRRGIIVAKNQKAKALGIQTTETVYKALKKCPSLVLRPARQGEYSHYCDRANAIYLAYTDLVEQASIDESYLDVTGTLHLFGGDAIALANEIRQRIHRELGLTISVGVSYNKFFAKMGSDMKKPNAVTHLSRDHFKHILWPLPIGEMHMVGKATEATLKKMNIHTIGDLATYDPNALLQKLGKYGSALYAYAHGKDDAPVLPPDKTPAAKSIGKHNTFTRNLITRDDIRTGILALSDEVAATLRREGFKCMGVQLTIKDEHLAVITRQKSIPPTWLADDLSDEAMSLLDAHWPIGRPIRLLAVTAIRLCVKDQAQEQLSLLDTPKDTRKKEKQERLAQAIDIIRDLYGSGSIQKASLAHSDIGIHSGHGTFNPEDVAEEEGRD